MHCSSGDQLLGQAPVWLSCIILFVLGGIVGAVGGVVGMVCRHRKLQRAKYSVTDSAYGGPYQSAGLVSQAQEPQHKSSWRSPPSASHSGFGIAPPSSKTASSQEHQYVSKNPMNQRLLHEEAIRQSGVSGPLGMGVVLQSMSKEPGELQHGASPQPCSPTDRYGRAPPTTSSTDMIPELPEENSASGTLADRSLAARHRHHDAKENMTAAPNSAYSHEKTMMTEHSPQRSPTPDQLYALQAIQAKNNAGAGGNPVMASRGPAMLMSDRKYAEFSSTPPLAASSSPGGRPSGAPQGLEAPAMPPSPARLSPSSSERSLLPMAPPPPRQTTGGRPPPPPPPPPPAMTGGGQAVKNSASLLPPLPGQTGRSPGPAAPPPPPPMPGQRMRGAPPPPPVPPPGALGQAARPPPRAPPPPSSTVLQSMGAQQGPAGTHGARRQQSGVVLSIAEQAAQMAARRGKAPAPQTDTTQSNITIRANVTSSLAGPAPVGPMSMKEGSSIATASAAHKHAPSDAYELEDLDEDWVAMLNVLDSRLLEVGRPTMMAKERAVAVRSLLISTGRDNPDVSLQKAIEDIERYRRIH